MQEVGKCGGEREEVDGGGGAHSGRFGPFMAGAL